MLQQKKPKDYVIATGKQYSIREFVKIVSKKLKMNVKWVGKGKNEKGIDTYTKKTIIQVDKNYFRTSFHRNIVKLKECKECKYHPKTSKSITKQSTNYNQGVCGRAETQKLQLLMMSPGARGPCRGSKWVKYQQAAPVWLKSAKLVQLPLAAASSVRATWPKSQRPPGLCLGASRPQVINLVSICYKSPW